MGYGANQTGKICIRRAAGISNTPCGVFEPPGEGRGSLEEASLLPSPAFLRAATPWPRTIYLFYVANAIWVAHLVLGSQVASEEYLPTVNPPDVRLSGEFSEVSYLIVGDWINFVSVTGPESRTATHPKACCCCGCPSHSKDGLRGCIRALQCSRPGLSLQWLSQPLCRRGQREC